jgi:hypothetical protein
MAPLGEGKKDPGFFAAAALNDRNVSLMSQGKKEPGFFASLWNDTRMRNAERNLESSAKMAR